MNGKNWARENLFGEPKGIGGGEAGGGRESDLTANFRAWVGSLGIEGAWHAGDLTLHPLIGGRVLPGPFLSAREALERGRLEIVEKDRGVVGELLAKNRGRIPILVPEGDTLVGCKQNRVVAHTVLVSPGTTVSIPVGCMEQGRWGSARGEFRSGSSRMEPDLRKRSVTSKIAATLSGSPPRLDQGDLWQGVAHRLFENAVHSPTSDYHVILEQREAEHREVLARVRPRENEIGVLVERGGVLVGLEVLGSPSAWAPMARQTLSAFLLAARRAGSGSRGGRDGSGGERGTTRSAKELLEAVATARSEARPALGLGLDFDLQSQELVGSGLWYEGAPAHLAVFGR